MSETLDRLRGLQYIPIFPLPLVLLPNEILPLHIFEQRYRKMLEDVLRDDGYFGVSLLEPSSAAEKPGVGAVGCLAKVRSVEALTDGRSNILTVGVIRYRLLDYVDSEEPYLVAEIETFEDELEESANERLEILSKDVFESFQRMARAAMTLSGKKGALPEMEIVEPEPLSFLITAAFSFENDRKYSLLEMTSTLERLTELKELLDPTVLKMEENAAILRKAASNGHGKRPDLN
jgi:ATP-dependent Lon protease